MPNPKPIKRLPQTFVKKVPHARPAPPAFQPMPSVAPERVAARATEAGTRQNLYVPARDQEIWNRAEQLAEPESLSGLVTRLLRRYVNQRQLAKDRIVVDIEECDQYSTRKAFVGRMLVSGYRSDLRGDYLFAAQGAKGGIAVWSSSEADGRPARSFSTFGNFDELADAVDSDEGWPGDFVSAASAALGEDFAEEIEL